MWVYPSVVPGGFLAQVLRLHTAWKACVFKMLCEDFNRSCFQDVDSGSKGFRSLGFGGWVAVS